MARYEGPLNNYDRAIDNVTDELDTQAAMRDLHWPEGLTRQLAEAIVSNLDYAFDIRWRPRWVKPGEPHHWSETGEDPDDTLYFTECLACGQIFESGSEASAQTAYQAHRAEEHAG